MNSIHAKPYGSAVLESEIAALRAENARLRKALSGYACYCEGVCPARLGDLCGRSAINEGAVLASRPQEKEDAEVYDAALRAHNGDLFRDLWAGQWKERGYPSQSEADFALINIIQFYSHNVEQVIRIFLLSGLGQREKARKRPDYVKRMAIRAFDNEQPAPLFPVTNNHRDTTRDLRYD